MTTWASVMCARCGKPFGFDEVTWSVELQRDIDGWNDYETVQAIRWMGSDGQKWGKIETVTKLIMGIRTFRKHQRGETTGGTRHCPNCDGGTDETATGWVLWYPGWSSDMTMEQTYAIKERSIPCLCYKGQSMLKAYDQSLHTEIIRDAKEAIEQNRAMKRAS